MQDGQPWRKGTWLTGVLWMVSLAAHFALDYVINPHSPNGGLGGASILLYVAVTYTLRRLLVQARARRLPVSDRQPESLTGSRP